MKKNNRFQFVQLIAMTLIFLLTTALSAQNEIQIGTGSTQAYDAGPAFVSTTYGSYKWSNHISIFTPQEIGNSNIQLTGFSWDKANAQGYSAASGQFRVYLKHTALNSISSAAGTFATEKAGSVLVYDGTSFTLPFTTGWMDYNFNTVNNFVYNGTENLMVLVEWYGPDAASGDVTWNVTSASGKAQTWIGDTNPPLINSGTDNRPNIKIRYSRPADPVVTGDTIICGDTAILVASGSTGQFDWYADSAGIVLIGSNDSLIFGPCYEDTVVYVAAYSVVDIEEFQFSACGLNGRYGPTQSNVNSQYLGTNLEGMVTVNTQGIQEWIVPETGFYRLEVAGAQGGPWAYSIGYGAVIRCDMYLTAGQQLSILVGQQGDGGLYDLGFTGGGGSFVVLNGTDPLVIAGGGGCDYNGGVPPSQLLGQTTTLGATAGAAAGLPGYGGNTSNNTGAGGGFYGNGAGVGGGVGFVNGGVGGYTTEHTFTSGGFGGGGARFGSFGEGCGGGYSGGNGGTTTSWQGGSGGGSYISTSASNVYTSNGQYDGLAAFNGQAVGDLAVYNAGNGNITIVKTDRVYSDVVLASITVNAIDEPQVSSPVHICMFDSVELAASGSSGIYCWFADSLGSVEIVWDSVLMTTPLVSDTVFYVAAYSHLGPVTVEFTNCGKAGRYGPQQSDVDTEYQGTPLEGLVTVNTEGIQEWVVPYDGVYTIEAAGGQGGPWSYSPGHGAILKGDVYLYQGQVIKILVGQRGEGGSYEYGFTGGGGSFVVANDTVPLVVAGGGGCDFNGGIPLSQLVGQTTNIGATAGATPGLPGEGGNTLNNTGPGGGFYSDGVGPGGGFGFLNGGVGAYTTEHTYTSGGFGGGGARTSSWGEGCGGGYSGGNGGNVVAWQGGSGGGSYIIPIAENVATSDGNYNSISTFNGNPISNINDYNAVHGYVKITYDQYMCISDLVPVYVNIDEVPQITSEPVDQNILENTSTTFSVIADGAGLFYQWQLSVDNGANWNDLTETSPYSNVTSSVLSISSAALSMDGYMYRCIVAGNCLPSDTSESAILNVYSDASVIEIANARVLVYPNPAVDELYVEFIAETATAVSLSVCNVLGEQVFDSGKFEIVPGKNKYIIDVNSFAKGIYFLRISSFDDQKRYGFIKQ